ncbi:unnamed protein product, partial [Owenia fusiformis]
MKSVEANGSYYFEPPSLGLSFIFISFDILSVVTNIAILYVILRAKPLWNPCGHFMFLVALLDTAEGTTTLGIIDQILIGKISKLSCRIQAYLLLAVAYGRLCIFTCMSINRAIMLKYPLRYETLVTTFKTKIVLLIIFELCFLSTLPVLLEQHTYRDHGYLCEIKYITDLESVFNYIWFGMIMLISTILIVANVSIFIMVRAQQKKINVLTVNEDGHLNMQGQRKKKADFRLQLKAIRMLFLAIGIYFIA